MPYNAMNNSRVSFSKDGKRITNISGMDMQAPMTVLAHEGNYVVFKRAGFTGWVSRGETGYYNPVYFLIHMDGNVIKEVLYEIETDRSTWRMVRNDLCGKAVMLNRGEK